MLLAVAIADIGAASAHAAEYKMLGCSGAARDPFYTVANNTTSPQNPGGIFNFQNNCGGQGADPPGNDAYLRIEENQASGYAGQFASLGFVFDTPNQFIHFRSAGAYTREPASFNDGWRARLWIGGGSAGDRQLMSQGAGLCNCGDQWATTSTFAPHLWPGGGYLDFTHFVFEMQCVRPGGCDRSGVNIADMNGMVFVLSDEYRSAVNLLATEQPFLAGSWVRGAQTVAYNWTELGSGMKMERVKVDGAVRDEIDHNCNVSWSAANGEYATTYQPCDTAADIKRYFPLDTAALPDGSHTVSACTQDYAQWGGFNGTGGESCDSRVVHTDNTAPGAPSGLVVTSANPNRYLERFGAQFALPPNQGSPITKVHYAVLNAAGEKVMPEQVVSAVDPTRLEGVIGPARSGAYQLKVWLEDEVGFTGPATTAPIPHDTTPPAAPQSLSVTAPGVSRAEQGLDVRWRNIEDSGSPIDAAHYQVLNGAGNVVVPTQDLAGAGIQSIADLTTAKDSGDFALRLWLSDAEGNTGAPVTAPLSYDCQRSEIGGGTAVSAGLGASGAASEVVEEGAGSNLAGSLRGSGGGVSGAALCVFSNVVTDGDWQFLGMAMTGQGGRYSFSVPPGPSRNLRVDYRAGQRQLRAQAAVQTRVHPTLRLQRKVVHNKGYARFQGQIPGPHNDNVVIVVQAKSGKGWRAFRRYRTRGDGHFSLLYRFSRTTTPTTYIVRAQVREQSGYPYVEGNSETKVVRVLP
jgi:hypothetical protein